MASYSLLLKRSAARELADLALEDRRRVVARIQGLSSDPRPPRCQKLSGEEKYRVRQGDPRNLYEIDDRTTTVTIVRVAHRKDAYR